MNNYYKQFKKDLIKDILGLIWIGIFFVGFCVGMFYVFK